MHCFHIWTLYVRGRGGCKGLPGWFGTLFSMFARFAHIDTFQKGPSLISCWDQQFLQQLFIVAVAFQWASCGNILEKRADTEQKYYFRYRDGTIDQNFIETVAKTCLWLCFAKRDVPSYRTSQITFSPFDNTRCHLNRASV